jgi:hypothetical protein
MDGIVDLRGDQIRQTIDSEQVFAAYTATTEALASRFKGAMSWKTVGHREYLYRKTGDVWKSLGSRSPETEQTYTRFHEGRDALKARKSDLAAQLDQMAAVNRAMNLGRMPQLTAKLIRAAHEAGLIGSALLVAGTNALYLYERMAGVHVASGLVATTDVDLLLDSRKTLKFLGGDISETGLTGLLRKVDKSFTPLKKHAYRAANNQGFLVDIIRPPAKNRLQPAGSDRFSDHDDDLHAIEIEGLQWLINSPRAEGIVLDERGYPVPLCCPDPRAFALHKLWLSRRADRDAAKKRRDAAQARIVAHLVVTRLPHLSFEDSYAAGMPGPLKALCPELLTLATPPQKTGDTPDW